LVDPLFPDSFQFLSWSLQRLCLLLLEGLVFTEGDLNR
jgi:hypothetical protein